MIQQALIISLVVYFLWVTTWPGMIWEKVGDWAEKLPPLLYKPLIGCPICMTPWWGGLIYFIAYQAHIFTSTNIVYIILTLFSAAGISAVLLHLKKSE